jgi:NADH dehydrogenase FAD-containing subunit
VGTLEFRCVTEPIRFTAKNINYHQAYCTNVDFSKKSLTLRSALEFQSKDEPEMFTLDYDKLVIASGAISNTFGVPGVNANAFFLKDINDARRIRHRVLECFEHSMQPGIDKADKRKLLHFAIVGGGPTGVEFAAELYDFLRDDMSRIYPSLFKYVRVTVYDVGSRILSSFDEKLGKFAADRFAREGIRIETGTGVSCVTHHSITLTTGRTVPVGMIVWATGLAPSEFITNLTCERDIKSGRIHTDEKLRLIRAEMDIYDNVYALGDCALVRGTSLPCTAQVAKQQAQYLARSLNQHAGTINLPADLPQFIFRPLGMMAYVGSWRAVADMRLPSRDHSEQHISGRLAWLIWRSAYFSMAVSLRNKILIPMYWFLTWIFGRDISKI